LSGRWFRRFTGLACQNQLFRRPRSGGRSRARFQFAFHIADRSSVPPNICRKTCRVAGSLPQIRKSSSACGLKPRTSAPRVIGSTSSIRSHEWDAGVLLTAHTVKTMPVPHSFSRCTDLIPGSESRLFSSASVTRRPQINLRSGRSPLHIVTQTPNRRNRRTPWKFLHCLRCFSFPRWQCLTLPDPSQRWNL